MKLSRVAYKWLRHQVDSEYNAIVCQRPDCPGTNVFDAQELANLRLTPEELHFLKSTCSYFNDAYLEYLSTFQLKPEEQASVIFTPEQDTGSDSDLGQLQYAIKGLWVETILYEIPLLALTSEAYFRFCDRDWDYSHQEERAFRKGCTLLEHGCIFSEFGSRRRRDYHTQDLVIQGLCRAATDGKQLGWEGKFIGTSNVHFAMRYGLNPVGTVAHEWYMAIAAYTNDYENANEIALRYWLGCFGGGVCYALRASLVTKYGR
jgi:nicotinate phosphoribosyltransferase